MHFADFPDARAAAAPDEPAVADELNGQLSNGEFLARIRTAAEQLWQNGVRRGGVVAVRLPNRAELVITLFAAWRLGAAVTPINPALTDGEADYQLADSGATVVVSDTAASVTVITPKQLAHPAADAAPVVRPDLEDLALLVYTSGTTGRPKAVELTHANISSMAQAMVNAMKLGPDAHSLLILPLFHVNGIVVGVLSTLLAGGRATIAGRFRPRPFLELLEHVRPTYFSAVPAMYAMLTALPDEVTADTSSVRFAVCGAAPMPVELIERFEKRFGITIVEGYGLSEGTCASACNPVDGPRKPGTVGPALPGQTVAIMDERGALLPPGYRGEVVVRGPNVMRGYRNRPDETAATLVDGWLHTGDIGFLDTDGYLTLVDRAKDMIIRGGENIYPKEIESTIYGHPGVQEAAVVGRPDPIYGEVPVAFVAFRPGADCDVEQVQEHLQRALARYKVPAAITPLPELPKNPVGKIDKPALRRLLQPSAPSAQPR